MKTNINEMSEQEVLREAVRLIAIEHLHDALQAGLNHEAMRHVIAAIRVLER